MNNWLLTLFIASVRDSVRGRRVLGCRYRRPVLTIDLDRPHPAEAKERRLYLTAVFSRAGSFLFLAGTDPLAGRRAETIFPRLERLTVNGLEQIAGDRIARLTLDRPAGGEYELNIMLFSGVGNALLAAGGEPVAQLNQRVKMRPAHSLPGAGTQPLGTIDAADLAHALAANSRIAGLDSRMTAVAGNGTHEAVAPRLIEFRDAVARGARPFWLVCPDRLGEAFPVPEPLHPALRGTTRVGPFNSCRDAASTIGRLLIAREETGEITRRTKPLRTRIEQKQSLLAKLRSELERARDHDRIRKQAETLAAFQGRIPAGASSVELPDPYGGDMPVKISLDPARPVRLQIDRLFKKASKMKRSLPLLERKIAQVSRDISALESELAALLRSPDRAAALSSIDRALDSHRLRKRDAAGGHPEERRYRRFDLDRMWFVLVGRNNRENDELTFHVAGPSDLWFHAQHVPGSHVILKSNGSKDNPPESILEAAAAIAAYFSKAKHATVVPVIYAQRKYVRKPRKAKPGQVICSQEQTIFAEPRLPRNDPGLEE